jgi:hypothetical protein
MKLIKEIMHSSRLSVTRIMRVLFGRIKILENNIAAQEQRLKDLESREEPNTHTMEISEENRRQEKTSRRGGLTDWRLKIDLMRQYGTTKWAKKLISEMINKRTASRVSNIER